MPIVLTAPSPEPYERLGFTVEDVRRMLETGVLDPDGRFELIDGEIIPMQAHNPPHMRVKRWLLYVIAHHLGDSAWVDSEPSLYLDPQREFTLPDIVVYPRALGPEEVRGADVLWLIEVADTTLKKDRGRKAALYARHGVRDYWVVEAGARTTFVYRNPEGGAYPPPQRFDADAELAPLAFPELKLRMRDAP